MEGLASFLADQLGREPRRVIVSPFLFFNRKTTSDLGWGFSGLIDGGRLKEYADNNSNCYKLCGQA